MKPLLGVNFCVIKIVEGEPYILLQKRDQNSSEYKGSWTIPGGAVERDKDTAFEETASRELAEEFDISIEPNKWGKLVDRPENNPGEVLITFLPEDENVSEQFEFEGENYQWHPVNKIHLLELGYKHNDFIVAALQEFVMNNFKIEEPSQEIKRPFGKIS